MFNADWLTVTVLLALLLLASQHGAELLPPPRVHVPQEAEEGAAEAGERRGRYRYGALHSPRWSVKYFRCILGGAGEFSALYAFGIYSVELRVLVVLVYAEEKVRTPKGGWGSK